MCRWRSLRPLSWARHWPLRCEKSRADGARESDPQYRSIFASPRSRIGPSHPLRVMTARAALPDSTRLLITTCAIRSPADVRSCATFGSKEGITHANFTRPDRTSRHGRGICCGLRLAARPIRRQQIRSCRPSRRNGTNWSDRRAGSHRPGRPARRYHERPSRRSRTGWSARCPGRHRKDGTFG